MTPSANSAGHIVTFYSYKGGTGRSMAVANAAWILASNGNRVLVIDWDLEAPGLHKYFHPFIRDKELVSTRGILDFLLEFASGAMGRSNIESSGTSDWFLPYTNILRYAFSLEWSGFPKPGTLDIVAAGRQDSQYPTRVNSFDWSGFYEKLGGGVFLEAVKLRMRADYDYILIDSRTGVSDTSGICTVQMPDDLVVCFTYNAQSIEGASTVAAAVHAQRRRPDGQHSVRIWPVPMRVELAEKEKLEHARDFARNKFSPFLIHLSKRDQDEYWRRIEVLYQPYYAYEEVLAVFGDRPGQTNSLLASMETLTSYLTDSRVSRAQQPDRPEKILELYGMARVRDVPSSVGTRNISARTPNDKDDREDVPNNVEEIVLGRLEDQIMWYDRKAAQNQRTYKTVRTMEFVFAATMPFFFALHIPYVVIVASVMSVCVVVLLGLEQLNQYHSNWISYRSTCEALKHEKYLYLAKTGPYQGTANSVAMLSERLESLISVEHSKWASVTDIAKA